MDKYTKQLDTESGHYWLVVNGHKEAVWYGANGVLDKLLAQLEAAPQREEPMPSIEAFEDWRTKVERAVFEAFVVPESHGKIVMSPTEAEQRMRCAQFINLFRKAVESIPPFLVWPLAPKGSEADAK